MLTRPGHPHKNVNTGMPCSVLVWHAGVRLSNQISLLLRAHLTLSWLVFRYKYTWNLLGWKSCFMLGFSLFNYYRGRLIKWQYKNRHIIIYAALYAVFQKKMDQLCWSVSSKGMDEICLISMQSIRTLPQICPCLILLVHLCSLSLFKRD